MAAGLPVLAVVGRPNVGKSTLVNRILGRREAVVQDTPGVTRDRVSYPAEWAGRDFTLVDTGGWEIDVKGLDRSVAEQAEIAVDLADAVVLVLDATVGVTASDERIVEMLRSKKKPIILAANKVDSPLQEADAAYLWSLGLGGPTRSRRCTDVERAISSTSSWRFSQASPPSLRHCPPAVRGASLSSAARTSASLPC